MPEGWEREGNSFLVFVILLGEKFFHPLNFSLYNKGIEERKISQKDDERRPRICAHGNADSQDKIPKIKRVSRVLVGPGNCKLFFFYEMA